MYFSSKLNSYLERKFGIITTELCWKSGENSKDNFQKKEKGWDLFPDIYMHYKYIETIKILWR